MKRFAGVLLIFALCSACSRIIDPVVATVDSETITASELKHEMAMERGKFDPAILSQETNFVEFRQQALDKLAQEKMLLAEAKRLGISPSKEELKQIETLRSGALAAREGDAAVASHGVDPRAWDEAQRRRLVIQKLIAKEVTDKVPVAEEKIASYFASHAQEFNRPAQFHARQLLVDSREQADEILAKLKQGQDFGELAKKFSLSPDGKRGGDLGFFDARAYPAAFAEVCQQLKIGEVSDVVQTDYGYQIFQLLEKRPARQIPYEEAAAEIRQRMKEEGSERGFDAWFAGIREKAKVAVNDEALKEVTLEKIN